jgi:UDP-N-acetylbacillosamine N-acetyltransferase
VRYASAKPKLVIWGAGGHARVVADIVRLRGEFEIVGFLDDVHPERRNTEFCGSLILGGYEQLDLLAKSGVTNLLFGFGDCAARIRLTDVAQASGFSFANAVHPRATIASDVHIGPGTIVAAGAVINPAARIGMHVIVNTCASIDHECVVADGAHISPGVHLAGNVMVGQAAWVGIGATIIERVRIGASALIGAGAVVTHDIPDGVIAYGVPAKIVKVREQP